MRAIAIAVVLAAAPAHAEVPAMSLHEALAYARMHQPSIAAARARVEVARAAAAVPRAAFAPRIAAAAEALVGTANNTTASYATINALDIARIGGTPANAASSWHPEPSTLAGIGVHQELYDFGRLEAQADALDALTHAANETARGAELDLDLLVEGSFYAVQGARAVLAASEAAVTRARDHRDLAQARVTAQLWSPVQLARPQADLAHYEAEHLRAAGALAIARSALAAAIGSAELAIDAGADDLTFASARANALHDAIDRAPELRAARAELAAQHAITDAIRRELAPDVSLSAELTGRAGGAAVATNPTPTGGGWIPEVPNWDALVVVSWPLYDRVVTARARTSRRVEAVRSAEIDQLSEQLRAVVERGTVELEVAVATLPALQRAVDAAQANQAQAEARFGQGLATAVELSDAEALLTDAQIQLALGRFQLASARARLARALGEASP